MFFFLISFYLLTRLPNLLSLPIFNDETLYLSMAHQLVLNPANNIFIGFFDGKEPLFFWLLGLVTKLISPALLGGRLLSISAGLVGLIFFYFLCRQILPKRATFLACLCYVLSPFILFYQRLAILDSLLVSLLTISLYFLVNLLFRPSLRSALFLGLALGLSLLTKTNSLIFIVALGPLILLPGLKASNKRAIVVFLLISLLVAFLIDITLILQPQYFKIGTKNTIFVYSIQQLMKSPGLIFSTNLKQTIKWLIGYEGLPAMVIFLSSPLIFRRKIRVVLPWVLMVILPLLAESLIAKLYFPRYFLFVVIPLSVVIGLTLNELLGKFTKSIASTLALFLVVFLPNLVLSTQIISQINQADLPHIEKWQYLSGWPSGYGLSSATNYLVANHIYQVVTEPITATNLGLPYFSPQTNWQFEVENFSHNFPQFSSNLKSSHGRTYFIFSQMQNIPKEWNLTELASFARPAGPEKIRIYVSDEK